MENRRYPTDLSDDEWRLLEPYLPAPKWRGRFKGRPEPTEPTELMIRATLIFRREDGEWKAVHRHGDNAVEKASPS